MRSHKHIQFKRRRTVTILLAVCILACWCLLAPSRRPLDAHVDMPETIRIGVPLFLEVTVNAPAPLPHLRPELSPLLQPHLILSHRPQLSFHGFSLRGPLWSQRYALIPISSQAIPSAGITVGDLSLTLPAITPVPLRPLPDEPRHLAPRRPLAPTPSWLALPLIASLCLACWYVRHRRLPRCRIQRLKPSPEALEKLPELLADAHVKRQSHPDFYHRLDQARFAPRPPDTKQLQDLLRQAKDILQDT